MKYSIVKTTTGYDDIVEIARDLGYTVSRGKNVGSPFYPIVSVRKNKVSVLSGVNAKAKIASSKKEGLIQVSLIEIIKFLIKNSPKLN